MFLVLLDWEKAFDKVNHKGMFEALKRMGIDEKLINAVKQLYENPTFFVEIDGVKSVK